jgi:hypothetical protein
LARQHLKNGTLVLYDVSSSYFPAQKSSSGSSRRLARKQGKLHRRTSIVYPSNKGI